MSAKQQTESPWKRFKPGQKVRVQHEQHGPAYNAMIVMLADSVAYVGQLERFNEFDAAIIRHGGGRSYVGLEMAPYNTLTPLL